jgi:tetratricopeptide (TPR) repeat protein
LDDKAQILCKKAGYLVGIGRYNEAVAFYLQALSLDPQHYSACCELSYVHLILKKFPKALEYAQRAVAIKPEHERGYRLQSLILLELRRNAESLRMAKQAIALSPEEVLCLYALSKAQQQSGLIKEAISTAERIRALAPMRIFGHDRLGLIAFNQRRWRDAEKHYLKVLEIEPENAMALNNLGMIYGNLGQKEKGMALLHQSLKQDPESGISKRNLKLLTHRIRQQRNGYWVGRFIGFVFVVQMMNALFSYLAHILKLSSTVTHWLVIPTSLILGVILISGSLQKALKKRVVHDHAGS